ncbi:hypothetical protein PG5_60530 [Pseudomonas sp. G5(2012)]|nr:hypothetical protein PG5_60530 [Pseudomonas sp. G5(2012)]
MKNLKKILSSVDRTVLRPGSMKVQIADEFGCGQGPDSPK